MDYPKEWDDLPRKERREKIKEIKRKQAERKERIKKVRNVLVIIAIVGALIAFAVIAMTKPPEQIALEEEMEKISLEDKVEEFPIEGAEHVVPGTDVEYETNPPTSGAHYSQPADWGVYQEELEDEAVVHSLEHGGIWISYNGISEEEKAVLEEIGKENPGSVIVSPRSENNARIAVASWGKLMKLEKADKAVIQKYILTYKNQSPEPLAQ